MIYSEEEEPETLAEDHCSLKVNEIQNFAFLHQRLLTDYRLKVDLLHLESDRITETLSPVNTDKCVNRSFFFKMH